MNSTGKATRIQHGGNRYAAKRRKAKRSRRKAFGTLTYSVLAKTVRPGGGLHE